VLFRSVRRTRPDPLVLGAVGWAMFSVFNALSSGTTGAAAMVLVSVWFLAALVCVRGRKRP
jgi:hypothetical protein